MLKQLAESPIFSFARQARVQTLATSLNDATQRSILIRIGEVMAKCAHRHYFVDQCGVGVVPLLSGSLGNAVEIGRDTRVGIPLATGMSKSCIDLATILFGVDGHTCMTG
jgi:hypothetical protein